MSQWEQLQEAINRKAIPTGGNIAQVLKELANDKQGVYTVYALLETTDNQEFIRYIGVTSNKINRRLSQHISEARHDGFGGYDGAGNPIWDYHCYCQKCEWIRGLARKDLLQIRPILWVSSKLEAEKYEKDLVEFFIMSGIPLVNAVRGILYEYNLQNHWRYHDKQ